MHQHSHICDAALGGVRVASGSSGLRLFLICRTAVFQPFEIADFLWDEAPYVLVFWLVGMMRSSVGWCRWQYHNIYSLLKELNVVSIDVLLFCRGFGYVDEAWDW